MKNRLRRRWWYASSAMLVPFTLSLTRHGFWYRLVRLLSTLLLLWRYVLACCINCKKCNKVAVLAFRWSWRTFAPLVYKGSELTAAPRNKWVLNETDVPLFFLFCQLVVAVILFLIAHMAGLVQLPIALDLQVCKGLIPMVGLNVVGLR